MFIWVFWDENCHYHLWFCDQVRCLILQCLRVKLLESSGNKERHAHSWAKDNKQCEKVWVRRPTPPRSAPLLHPSAICMRPGRHDWVTCNERERDEFLWKVGQYIGPSVLAIAHTAQDKVNTQRNTANLCVLFISLEADTLPDPETQHSPLNNNISNTH